MKKGKILILSAAAAAAAVLVCSAAARPVQATAETDTRADKLVTVAASAEVSVVPDKAEITVGVRTEQKEAKAAQDENTEIVNQVIAVLKERGVEEKSIRTSGYNLYPRYDYEHNDAIIGYSVETTLTIKDQEIAEVGTVLSECVAAGATSVHNISYFCSTYSEAYEEALTMAVAKSREKAEVLAKAAGKEIRDVVSITEGYQNNSSEYSNVRMESAKTADAANVSIMPGETGITAQVTVSYRMK
ncbi:MAG: SIMPL domain-containing protein [Lachnospiraceae bacterium]|nr:SIMPL domain-containing protein [Lachnospiraceae bacterium]MBQ9643612.1 SIMPL domain-containing protein [Lachnospiraceae bacterium]